MSKHWKIRSDASRRIRRIRRVILKVERPIKRWKHSKSTFFHTKKQMLFFTPLLSLSAVSAQANTACGSNLGCLAQQSQYTVIGTVISNNLNDPGTIATPQNYNATISIKCNYLSFANPPSTNVNLVGKTLKVVGFGRGSSRCQRGGGSDAIVNQTAIFFLSVFTKRPLDLTTADYSVVDICYGAFDADLNNNQTISNLMTQYPNNKIPVSYTTAPGAQCGLPAPQVKADDSGSNGGSSPFPEKEGAGYRSSAIVGTVVLAVLLTLALL
jgi:hypothetical protein